MSQQFGDPEEWVNTRRMFWSSLSTSELTGKSPYHMSDLVEWIDTPVELRDSLIDFIRNEERFNPATACKDRFLACFHIEQLLARQNHFYEAPRKDREFLMYGLYDSVFNPLRRNAAHILNQNYLSYPSVTINEGYRGVKRDSIDLEHSTSYYEPGCQPVDDYGRPFTPDPSEYSQDEYSDSDMELIEHSEEYDAAKKQCLNGNNGEWTNGDDMPKKVKTAKQKQRSQRKNAKKAFARDLGKMVAADFVGNTLTDVGYMVGARTARGVKRTIKNTKKMVPSIINSARSMIPTFGGKTLHLSDAASRYLQAFLNPFDERVSRVKIPRPPAQRSFPVTGFIRGSGFIGLQGFGFVAMNPCLANDVPAVLATTAAYNQSITGTLPNDTVWNDPSTVNGTANNPAAYACTNLPYTYGTLVTTASAPSSSVFIGGRNVSCSLRVWYTGTTFYEGGQYFAYVDPEGENVLGDNHAAASPPTGLSAAQFASKDATEILKVKGQNEMRIIKFTTDPNMDDYPRLNSASIRKVYPQSGGMSYNGTLNGIVGFFPAVVCVTGTAGQPFYWEYIVHNEYIGPGVAQSLFTDTDTDAVGYDCVKNILAHAQRDVATNPRLTLSKALKQEMAKQGVVFGHSQRSVDY